MVDTRTSRSPRERTEQNPSPIKEGGDERIADTDRDAPGGASPSTAPRKISRCEILDYWVGEITVPSRQTLEGILQIGARILKAEASGLTREEIRQLREDRLPFSPADYSRYKSIGRHEGLMAEAYREYLPVAYGTLYVLSQLPLEAFRAVVAEKRIHPRMTREQAEALRDELLGRPDKTPKKPNATAKVANSRAAKTKGGARPEAGKDKGQVGNDATEELVATIVASKKLKPDEVKNIITLLDSIKGTESGIRITRGPALDLHD